LHSIAAARTGVAVGCGQNLGQRVHGDIAGTAIGLEKAAGGPVHAGLHAA
jgi:hypothetical protein